MGCGASSVAPAKDAPASADSAAPADKHPKGSAVANDAAPYAKSSPAADDEAPADPTIWEAVRALRQEPKPLSVKTIFAAHMCVSIWGDDEPPPGRKSLSGTGAQLLEPEVKKDGSTVWRIQPEEPEAEAVVIEESLLKPLPPLPSLGISPACLRAFKAVYASHFESDDTTAQLCSKVVGPLTEGARSSLAAGLQRAAAPGSAAARWTAPANIFVSHAWRYRAVDVFDAMLAFAERHEAAGSEQPLYFFFDVPPTRPAPPTPPTSTCTRKRTCTRMRHRKRHRKRTGTRRARAIACACVPRCCTLV